MYKLLIIMTIFHHNLKHRPGAKLSPQKYRQTQNNGCGVIWERMRREEREGGEKGGFML